MKKFDIVLKDDEVLAVYFGIHLLGIIIRPTIEKVIKLVSSTSFEKCNNIDGYNLINEYIHQHSNLELGIQQENFRCLEKSIKLAYSYELENHPKGLGTTLYETFNLEITKILI
jgi:hypothetical protein